MMLNSEKDQNSILKSLGFYNLLSDTDKVILLNGSRIVNASPNESIYNITDNKSYIYYLVKGKVKLKKQFRNQEPKISGIIPAGKYFGLKAMGKERQNLELAVVLLECLFIRISIKTVRILMKNNVSFSLYMFNQVLEDSANIESYWEMIYHSKSVKSRVILMLIRFSNDFGEKVGDEIMIKLNLYQHEIAEYLIVSRQTVTQALNDLKKENLIYFDRSKILIRDMNKLVNYDLE